MSDTAGVPTDASIRSIINSLLDDFENETDRLIGAFAFLAQTGKQPSDEVGFSLSFNGYGKASLFLIYRADLGMSKQPFSSNNFSSRGALQKTS
jgi:hypothetical protein